MYYRHLNSSMIATNHSRAKQEEFQEEAEKLRELMTDVLEQELVWGDEEAR